jgi:hypothetical protein
MLMPAAPILNYSDIMTEPLYVPAPLGGTNDRMLAAYADALRDQVIEGFRLYHVRVELDWMPQLDEFIRVTVLTDDPQGGEAIWPIPRLIALSQAIGRLAWQFGIAEPIRVREVSLRSGIESGIPAEIVARARAAAERQADPGRG